MWSTIADGEPTQKCRSRLFGTPEIERTYWKIKRATPKAPAFSQRKRMPAPVPQNITDVEAAFRRIFFKKSPDPALASGVGVDFQGPQPTLPTIEYVAAG